MTVAVIVVAAGSGLRLGADLPKAFVLIAGETMLEHACARFLGHPDVRDILVVAPAAYTGRARELVPTASVVAGGSTRQESVSRGLVALAVDIDIVLVHDVARPFVTSDMIGRVLVALEGGAQVAIPAIAVVDAVKEVDGREAVVRTLERARLRAVQTPQGFRRAVLSAAHAVTGDGDAVDDATLAERAGIRVQVVAGAREALKITHPEDLVLAEWLATR